MKELIAEEESERERENLHQHTKFGSESNRMRSVSCGRGMQSYGNGTIKKGKKITEMTHRERVSNLIFIYLLKCKKC